MVGPDISAKTVNLCFTVRKIVMLSATHQIYAARLSNVMQQEGWILRLLRRRRRGSKSIRELLGSSNKEKITIADGVLHDVKQQSGEAK